MPTCPDSGLAWRSPCLAAIFKLNYFITTKLSERGYWIQGNTSDDGSRGFPSLNLIGSPLFPYSSYTPLARITLSGISKHAKEKHNIQNTPGTSLRCLSMVRVRNDSPLMWHSLIHNHNCYEHNLDISSSSQCVVRLSEVEPYRQHVAYVNSFLRLSSSRRMKRRK